MDRQKGRLKWRKGWYWQSWHHHTLSQFSVSSCFSESTWTSTSFIVGTDSSRSVGGGGLSLDEGTNVLLVEGDLWVLQDTTGSGLRNN